MEDWSGSMIWIVLIISVLIYNLKKLQYQSDPKEGLLTFKKLKDEGVIDDLEYEKLKAKTIKKIEL